MATKQQLETQVQELQAQIKRLQEELFLATARVVELENGIDQAAVTATPAGDTDAPAPDPIQRLAQGGRPRSVETPQRKAEWLNRYNALRQVVDERGGRVFGEQFLNGLHTHLKNLVYSNQVTVEQTSFEEALQSGHPALQAWCQAYQAELERRVADGQIVLNPARESAVA